MDNDQIKIQGIPTYLSECRFTDTLVFRCSDPVPCWWWRMWQWIFLGWTWRKFVDTAIESTNMNMTGGDMRPNQGACDDEILVFKTKGPDKEKGGMWSPPEPLTEKDSYATVKKSTNKEK